MSILSKIRDWLTGGRKKKSVSREPKQTARQETRTVSEDRSVGQYGTSASYRRALVEARKKKAEQDKKVAKAFKTKEFTPTTAQATKTPKPDPKETARKASQEKARKRLEDIKKERKEYHEATGHRYDVNEKGISKEEKTKRRQAQKSQAYDVEAEKFETKAHPIATSVARGAASGVTLGASELLAQKSKSRKESGAEEFYQKNKNKTAETVGEIAGSLASFGLTAGATEKAAAKIGGRAIERGAERLAESNLVKGAAKRSVDRAVKKGLIKEGSEELIKQVGKEKAKKVATALGTDVVQNLTTGALYDVNKASAEHEVGSSDWWKELGKSAALNAAITGGVAGVSAARGGKRMAVEAADELGRLGKAGFVKQAPDAKVSLKRRRKTNISLPNERPASTISEADVDDALIESATTTEDFMDLFGLDRATAEILAEDKARQASREAVQVASEASRRGIPRGNIKPLAEKLKVDELMPRQRNAQFASAPRSAERVDTSIEGLSRRLDELKAQTPQTGKERRAIETKIHDVEDRLNRTEWRKEGGADMDAMRKAYRGEYAGFDMSKSTNSHQSDVLEGKVKGKTATVVEMSPDEYMERAYRQIFKKPSKRGSAFAEIPETSEKVAQYAEAMRNGEKFPLPYLDYTNAGQEGRHRALAAKMAGIDKIPVVVIDDATNPKSIIEDVAEMTAKNANEAAEARVLSDEVPFAGVDEAMPSTDPALTAENETRAALEKRVNEIAEEDIPFTDSNGNPVTGENLKVNKVAEDEAISGDLPSGVKQVRSAYEYNNGEEPKLEDGILTSWNEAWKASLEYSKSHATGDKSRMSKVAVSQLNAMDSNAERKLRQKLADSGELNYDAIRTDEMYDKIAKQMRDDPNRWIKDMIEINEGGALDFRSTPEWQARVQYIMGTVDPSADAASEIAYTEAFKLAQNISSKGGQTLNLRRNFVHLTPMGKRDAILDDFINILGKSKGFRSKHPKLNSLGYFDQREYMRSILMEDDGIRDGVEKLVNANELDDVSEAFAELMIKVNKKNPKAGFDVIQELRYLNMLGNPKTHIRNVFGSAFFAPMRQVSNGIRSMIEKPIERYARRVSGGSVEVTRHGGLSLVAAKEAWVKNPTTEAGQAALEAFKKNKTEILGSAKLETTIYAGRGKTLVGKGVDKLSDFNSKLLSGEDDFFRSRAYRENYIKSYNRYVKDGKPITDKVKRRIEKEALQESQIATFNEYNNFAKWLSSITSKANDANASTLARWGGRGVNAVMPFTKVPANLMKQSINYSPLGIAKGFANIKTAAKKGDAELLNRAIDELSSGLTGTAVFGLGMLLGKTTHNMFGLETNFTTNAGKNDPDAKFKKDRGMQNYSVTFKDPETGQGHSFTLDWLVPTSATFFSGIEMASQLQSGDFNLLDIGGDWSTVVTRLAEPVMETSMLSGLHGMLETMRGGSNDDDTKSAIGILMRETIQSWGNSLVPTIAGQASRTAYKTDMQITGDTDWEYWRNQVKSKAGLANTKILGEPLGADTDAYGNVKGEKNSTADYVKAGLKNFLSPSNIQKVDISEVDKAKLDEYERRVKDGESPEDLAYLFPKKQYKKQFKLAGEEVKMSNRDLSTYNQAKTKGGEEGMRFVLENIMFNRQTVDENGKKVPADSAYTKDEKTKLMNQFKGKSMRDVEKWLYDQPEFKNATDAERKRAIEGLWKLTKDTKAVASQRVGEQAVIKAQGGDVNEYNFKNEVTEKKREALEPLIAAGVVTYEEAVDFARNAGKTYYTENEEGGSSATYYNKKEMIQYLIDKGYSYEKAEALFNAFKQSNAKPYSGNNLSSGRRGYGRRRYGGYRRRGGGGSSKVKVPAAKASAYKTKTFKATAKVKPPTKGSSSGTTSLASMLKNIQDTEEKVRAPIKKDRG